MNAEPEHTKPAVTGLTRHLHAWRAGDDGAFGPVFKIAERELRAIARKRLLGSSGQLNGSLMPADLLHEAVLKVLQLRPEFESGQHFIATMSLVMRQVLVDMARAAQADRRNAGGVLLTLTDSALGQESATLDLIALDQALTQLEAVDARTAEVMHLTYFAGISNAETAQILATSLATVERDLKFGRAWISRAMRGLAPSSKVGPSV